MPTPMEEYFAAIVGAAEEATGGPVAGTVIAPDTTRSGTGSATSYPTPAGTVVWCDPALVQQLAPLSSPNAHSTDEFVEHAVAMGATLSGCGNNRVLVATPRAPSADVGGLRVRPIDRGDPADKVLLTALAGDCSEQDLDEADLDLDDLDPVMTALIDAEGTIAAFAGARPSRIDASFDDLGVLTHPASRRRGLGAHIVYEFVQQRAVKVPQQRMLYRCTVENAGSNAIAESLGFTFAHRIGAVRFP